MKTNRLSIILFAFILASCTTETKRESALLQYDAEIDGIIDQMTLEEKVNMLHGKTMFSSAGVERLGIADMKYADGPFGIREEIEAHSWAPLGWELDSATFFPTGSALAATWSPELAYKYGTGLAREAKIRGKDMLLGPAINIQRIPTGGRTYEYLSEDPHLSSELAVAYTKGVQDNGIAVCLKHYALNNQENNRGNVNVIIGERAMREIYLPPFRDAVIEADAFGVMAAYNKVAGRWCSENDILQNQILRDEWGFAGMIVSDWGGTHSSVDAVVNGLNVEMPDDKYLGQALLDSVKAGAVSEDVINQRVREILRVRMAIEAVPEEEANKVMTSQAPQQKIAYEVASKSIVLLENDGILPLNLENNPVIAVIGDNATRPMALGGVGAGVKALYEVSPLEGLENKIGESASLLFARGYVGEVIDWARMNGNKSQEQMDREDRAKAVRNAVLNKEAVEIAKKADIVLYFAGDNRAVETESMDRENINLPSGQDLLMEKLVAVNENIVTVLVSGAPNDLRIVEPLSRALVLSWFNGTEGGNALADVLVGNISPSGRLPFTMPVKLEDVPAYALGNYPQGAKNKDVFVDLVDETDNMTGSGSENPAETRDPNDAYYSEESLVGYRWYDTKEVPVMYPFGYGMSYSTFEYKDLATNSAEYGKDDVISLTFELSNTGSMDADEVVQVYVHRINSSIEWPVKELKAFSRESLTSGESRHISLEIPVKDLYYWNEDTYEWTYDPCEIELLLGASAGDIKIRKQLSLK